MSAGIGTQITPLECRIVNAISSGVALAAAKMMSPSFSRSSSSTTTTALPAAMSAIARSTLSRRMVLIVCLQWSRQARPTARGPRCGWRAARRRSPRSRVRRRRRRGSRSGTAGCATAGARRPGRRRSRHSQKSVQPLAIAKVATMEPTKIQASHQKYHRSTGKPAPITANSHWKSRSPARPGHEVGHPLPRPRPARGDRRGVGAPGGTCSAASATSRRCSR